MIYHINKMKDKKKNSTWSFQLKQEKYLVIQPAFMTKSLKKIEIDRKYLNIIKSIYDKITDIIFNRKN